MRKKNPTIRFISLILSIIIILSTSIVAMAEDSTTTEKLYGDVNSDGKISSTDSAIVIRITIGITKLESVDITIADVSGDGKVSSTDTSLIDRYVQGGIKVFPIESLSSVPIIGDYTKLNSVISSIATYQRSTSYDYSLIPLPGVTPSPGLASTPAPVATSAVNSNKVTTPDYSTTNTQVAGVDESDIVKTDGKYIFQVNNNKIVVAEAYPADSMKVVNTITFDVQNFRASEMYLENDKLIVIGSCSAYIPIMKTQSSKSLTCVLIYDVTDKSNIKLSRTVKIDGSYVSSRRIDNILYFVSNSYISYNYSTNFVDENTDLLPVYMDSYESSNFKFVDYSYIRYFPEALENRYMNISSIDISSNKSPVNIKSFLGAGEKVYVSKNSLYVTSNRYTRYVPLGVTPTPSPSPKSSTTVSTTSSSNQLVMPPPTSSTTPTRTPSAPAISYTQNGTIIYKFDLYNGMINYGAKGNVPGTVLNQYSMDEYKDSFRIATTTGYLGGTGTNLAKNNLYILDSRRLKQTGSIEGMAPGEKIYSVRFMGDRGYIVTFKDVDPLFVIDLTDSKDPKILGQLKIPGYSDYLHPYDENHVIGIGKDAINYSNTNAYYQGMKIALFDITDVTNPKQKFEEIIGDRGTQSDVLTNPKALLFSKEKNLLSFPVSVSIIKDKTSSTSITQAGTFEFQGAYVYNLDLTNGFKLKGRITHLTEDEILKTGTYSYYGINKVERIMYINDTLYTLSQGYLKANNISDLKELNSVKIR